MNHYTVFGHKYYVLRSSRNYEEQGVASWYGTKFHSHHTSNGERYDMLAMTAAHKTLPLPTYVQVTNLRNGKKVIVKINDRGPFESNRLIDLSYVAAKKLGMLGHGTTRVDVKAIDPRDADVSPYMNDFVAQNPTTHAKPMHYASRSRHYQRVAHNHHQRPAHIASTHKVASHPVELAELKEKTIYNDAKSRHIQKTRKVATATPKAIITKLPKKVTHHALAKKSDPDSFDITTEL
jgi:rare lipoprotein A